MVFHLNFHAFLCYTDFCPSGQEQSESGCSDCSKGYYKDNGESVSARFDSCQPCPSANLTTPGTGATNRSQCSVGKYCEAIAMYSRRPQYLGFEKFESSQPHQNRYRGYQ